MFILFTFEILCFPLDLFVITSITMMETYSLRVALGSALQDMTRKAAPGK